MALPEKVIEKLGREPARSPGWSGRLLMFSSAVFIASIVAYFGLRYGYQPYLRSRVEELDNRIKKFTQDVPLGDQVQLATFYSQLANIEKLLDQHIAVSPLFPWLEENTHANVYFTKFTLDAGRTRLALAGIARTRSDAVDQARIFQAQPDVREVGIARITLDAEGRWQFDFVVVFRSALFHAIQDAAQPEERPAL